MADDKANQENKSAAAAGGGESKAKAMLPLILTVALMPVLAFVMTQFVLLPKLQKALVADAKTVDGHGDGDDHATTEESKGGHGKEGEGPVSPTDKATFSLTKIIVNVRGSMGTRYLMSSFTLVGKGQDFIGACEVNEDQLRDVAGSVLSTKTIQDLEKPGARNMIRTELMSTFNTALGKPMVREIYITEFAIQ